MSSFLAVARTAASITGIISRHLSPNPVAARVLAPEWGGRGRERRERAVSEEEREEWREPVVERRVAVERWVEIWRAREKVDLARWEREEAREAARSSSVAATISGTVVPAISPPTDSTSSLSLSTSGDMEAMLDMAREYLSCCDQQISFTVSSDLLLSSPRAARRGSARLRERAEERGEERGGRGEGERERGEEEGGGGRGVRMSERRRVRVGERTEERGEEVEEEEEEEGDGAILETEVGDWRREVGRGKGLGGRKREGGGRKKRDDLRKCRSVRSSWRFQRLVREVERRRRREEDVEGGRARTS